MDYIKNPERIENGSFDIIYKEMTSPEAWKEEELPIVQRVIHTTADFEYEKLIKIHPRAIEKGLMQIQKGTKIYCDTNMIAVGVNRILLKEFACEVVNLVHEPRIHEIAKKKQITRSMAAMEEAIEDTSIKIFLIGNAPTALMRLLELAPKERLDQVLIVGVPVGFVGAAESKEALMKTDFPWIAVQGRKGGSPVAVAIMNALLKLKKKEGHKS